MRCSTRHGPVVAAGGVASLSISASIAAQENAEDAGAFELEAFSSGQTCNATYDLEPGEYTLFCIIETADGETHYELGMQGTLTVS